MTATGAPSCFVAPISHVQNAGTRSIHVSTPMTYIGVIRVVVDPTAQKTRTSLCSGFNGTVYVVTTTKGAQKVREKIPKDKKVVYAQSLDSTSFGGALGFGA